jgi:hypothetical protein
LGVREQHQLAVCSSLQRHDDDRVDLDGNGQADLVASFSGYGIWVFRNNTTWTFLNPYTPVAIAAGHFDAGPQADLIVDFGPSFGIWTYSNSAIVVAIPFSQQLRARRRGLRRGWS